MKKFMLFVIILIMIINSGCIEKKDVTQFKNQKRNYIVYNIGKLPQNLNMLDSSSIRDKDMLIALFEGLVKFSGMEDGKGNDIIVPALAESWSISKDGTIYTFKIRENAKWSDGLSISAGDFVNFFSSILQPGNDNLFCDELNSISGAHEFREGKCTAEVLGIKSINEDTLEIKLSHEDDDFLNILAEPIYSLRVIDSKLFNWEKAFDSILYTGPFKIKSISGNGEVTLVRNDNYWNKDDVKSNKIIVTSYDGSEESLARFKTNDIDAFVNPPESNIEELEESGYLKFASSDMLSYISFNFKKNDDLEDENVRLAIAGSIDNSDLASKNLNSSSVSAFAFKPRRNSSKSDKISTSVNNKYDKALKLIYYESIENKRICNSIAESIKKKTGITVKVIGMSYEELKKAIENGDYDMIQTMYYSNMKHPLTVLELFTTSYESNVYGYSNKSFDRLVTLAEDEKNKVKKLKLIKDSEDILSSDLPGVPLYYLNTVLCKKKNISGIFITRMGNIMLDRAYMDADD